MTTRKDNRKRAVVVDFRKERISERNLPKSSQLSYIAANSDRLFGRQSHAKNYYLRPTEPLKRDPGVTLKNFRYLAWTHSAICTNHYSHKKDIMHTRHEYLINRVVIWKPSTRARRPPVVHTRSPSSHNMQPLASRRRISFRTNTGEF